MVIRIDDDPGVLHELLWIREAWQLDVEGADLPPKLVDTPQSVTSDGQIAPAEWAAGWPELWRACVDHAAGDGREDSFDQLQRSEPGSAERARMLLGAHGPSWRSRFDETALADGYRTWSNAIWERRTTQLAQSDDDPERSALAALIPAWEAGLTKIIQIPCQGTYSRVVGAHALLITAETRADVDRYRASLETFAG